MWVPKPNEPSRRPSAMLPGRDWHPQLPSASGMALWTKSTSLRIDAGEVYLPAD